MKRTLIFICCLTFFSGVAFSQSRTDLKGPKAKNYKPWKYEANATEVQSEIAETVAVKGPKAKNQKVWREEDAKNYVTVSTEGDQKTSLKGPKAKNYKPWKKDTANR